VPSMSKKYFENVKKHTYNTIIVSVNKMNELCYPTIKLTNIEKTLKFNKVFQQKINNSVKL